MAHDSTAAETARSILASATDIELVVDGVDHPLAEEPLGVQDCMGSPTFICPRGGPLPAAGECGLRALLAVDSDQRPGERLMLAGRLRFVGSDDCPCGSGGRDYVALELDEVRLAGAEGRVSIDVADYCDPRLQLNAGFLARSQEHINDAHGEQLREAIARRTTGSADAIAGAQLTHLSATGVEVQWVNETGAHTLPIAFAEAARNADELSWALRRTLHPDMC